MRRALGCAGLALVLAGCAAPAPSYYYCIQIVLIHPDGRRIDALECSPKARKVPWHPSGPTGRDLLS